MIFMLLVSVLHAEDFWTAILCYHKVFPKAEQEFEVSTENFEKQMKFIKESFLVVSLKDFIDHIDSKTPYTSNTVIVTFDDGDKSIYKYALPILKKYDVPMTLFLYSNVTKEKRGLTWEEIKEMSDYGIDFGSHGQNHIYLTRKDENETEAQYEEKIKQELNESKREIEEKTGKPVKCLAYPYGKYNTYVEKEALKAGYEVMLTVHWDKNTINSNKYRLRRRIVPKTYNMEKFVNIFKGNIPDGVNDK